LQPKLTKEMICPRTTLAGTPERRLFFFRELLANSPKMFIFAAISGDRTKN
jgi:hypothetical protein